MHTSFQDDPEFIKPEQYNIEIGIQDNETLIQQYNKTKQQFENLNVNSSFNKYDN